MPTRARPPKATSAEPARNSAASWPFSADLIPNEGRSLRYRVADALRQSIIEGEFQPGERILEEETSQRLGLSRGPVREGMRVLEQEGFVMSFPNRGTVVLPLTEEEVREVLIPIRLVLEKFAFRLAMQETAADALRPFEDVLARMRKAAEREDRYGVAEADISFHRQVFRLAGHYHSLTMWNAIAPRTKAYFVRYPATLDLDRTVRDHEVLLDALRDRDFDRLQALLVPHITRTGLDTAAMNATPGSQVKAHGKDGRLARAARSREGRPRNRDAVGKRTTI